MNNQLENYFSLGKAIGLLLYPHGEVVIHDLQKQTIAAIFNNSSKRKVGDESLLEPLEHYLKLPDVFPIYSKINWDGKKMKSVSAILRDKKGVPIGLFCINLDMSKWEEMGRFLNEWIQSPDHRSQPESLFKNDWRENINIYIDKYLKKNGLIIKTMDKEAKRKLVHSLHEEGGFQAKNAAAYIADILGVSRATIYNYLRK